MRAKGAAQDLNAEDAIFAELERTAHLEAAIDASQKRVSRGIDPSAVTTRGIRIVRGGAPGLGKRR